MSNMNKNKGNSGATRIWETGDKFLHTPCASGYSGTNPEPSFLSKQIVWDPPIKVEKYVLDGKVGYESVKLLKSNPVQWDPEYEKNRLIVAPGFESKFDNPDHPNEMFISYNVEYQRLLKEAKIWFGQGQYKLGYEAKRRAKCLLNGDISGYEVKEKPENLIYPTKIKNSSTAPGSTCVIICEQCKGCSSNHNNECPMYVEKKVHILDAAFEAVEGAVEGTVVEAQTL